MLLKVWPWSGLPVSGNSTENQPLSLIKYIFNIYPRPAESENHELYIK